MINQEAALQIAQDALRAKNIPFKGMPFKQQLIAGSSDAKWHMSFDILMPFGMQDEYFTVVVNAETGAAEGIITPTAVL